MGEQLLNSLKKLLKVKSFQTVKETLSLVTKFVWKLFMMNSKEFMRKKNLLKELLYKATLVLERAH